PQLLHSHRQHVTALEAYLPADNAALLVEQADERGGGDALARAGFADDAQRLAGRNREAYAIDGAQRAGIGEELRPEVAPLQHRRGRRAGGRGRWLVHRLPYRLRDRGSSQSRMPSPRKLNPSTTERMARPGNVATHHCSISSRPSDTIEPHSGVGGTTP